MANFIIELSFAKFHKKIQKIPKNRLTKYISRDRINELSLEGLVNRETKKSFEKVLTSPSEDDRMIELSLEGTS